MGRASRLPASSLCGSTPVMSMPQRGQSLNFSMQKRQYLCWQLVISTGSWRRARHRMQCSVDSFGPAGEPKPSGHLAGSSPLVVEVVSPLRELALPWPKGQVPGAAAGSAGPDLTLARYGQLIAATIRTWSNKNKLPVQTVSLAYSKSVCKHAWRRFQVLRSCCVTVWMLIHEHMRSCASRVLVACPKLGLSD